jgi:hypothetical protein
MTEQLVHDIENRFNDYLDARIDVCIVSIMTWESPDITDFHENDEAGTFCRSINNGIEIYMHDHIIGKVTYSSWDYSGDVDEGFLEDEEDEDWCFNPDWDKSFSAIKLKTTKG